MAHVGGGSNSGGFHSGGSSNGSTIKYDVYGNKHKDYYRGPGFYYHGIRVHYSNKGRTFYTIKNVILSVLVSILFFCISFIILNNEKSDDKLEEYSLKEYNNIYNSNENNILIEIVAYDNLKELDYLPIVGDNVDKKVDNMFGNQKSYFGSIFYNNLNNYDEKVSNLYEILSISLSNVNGELKEKYITDNESNSKIYNHTSFNLGDDKKLLDEMEEFYLITGYNISIDIINYNMVYTKNVFIFIVFITISIIILIISIFSLIKHIKAVKFINEEEKKGNLDKYFEGEIKFDEFLKRHPLDIKFKYNDSENDELRKQNKK